MSSEHRSRSPARFAWKIAATVATALSLAWVILLLAKVWPDLAARSSEIRIFPMLFGLLLSVAAAYLTFVAFETLVRILRLSTLPRRELAHLYFTAQLLKHLPGRVWGLGYQWAVGRSAGSLGDWLLVNLVHMLLATFFALWSACLALGYSREFEWGLLTTAAGGITYLAGWMLASSLRNSRPLKWLPGRIGRLSRGILEFLARTPTFARARLFVIFSISWVFYYTAWFLFGLSYPSLGGGGGVRLCAFYMLAWFVGYISLLTPSGLGVRELVFAWLAKDFPGDAVALMAVIGRMSLLSVDVALGLLFAPFVPRKP